MKQLLQDLETGALAVHDVPAPGRGPASLLVATRFSLISAGTERAMTELGRKSLAGKARARPDLARKVVEAARAEGVAATYAKVRGRLAQPSVLGYSSAGVVLEGCEEGPAAPGELVACAGAGIAAHAEIVSVPRTLAARAPEGVAAEDAAYATVTAIALHGARMARVELGAVVAVVGLGLVGQLALDVVAAAGAVPLGLDPDPCRRELAEQAGHWATSDPRDLIAEARRHTRGRGADAALIAAASREPQPLETAIAAARERAVVCVVGDVPIRSPRAPLYEKEISVVVSRSYGPGRYDRSYEEAGVDYPAGYVRWTEGRNLEEALRLMAAGALRPSRLTTHTFDLEDGPAAYELLESGEPSLGILLRYAQGDPARGVRLPARSARRPLGRKRERLRVGLIGTGAFARGTLLPNLAPHADVVAVAAATGASAAASARRLGAGLATTDVDELLAEPDLEAVVIATRHDTHAPYAAAALRAGKHVFLEKPLAVDEAGVAQVEAAYADSDGVLMVGFNRRFAPLAQELRGALGGAGPLVVHYRVSAGRLERGHWAHEHGGRIVGEVCHFVDFAAFLCGAPPVDGDATALGGATSEPHEDDVVCTARLADGSLATITYVALGDSSLPKERVEVFGEAGAGVLEDFSALTLHRHGDATQRKGRRDKGHARELAAFAQACHSGRQPWPFEDMAAVTRSTFAMRAAALAT